MGPGTPEGDMKTHRKATFEIRNQRGVVKQLFESANCGGPNRKDWPLTINAMDVTCGLCIAIEKSWDRKREAQRGTA